MKRIGITELKNNFSRYIDQVKRGQAILVLNRKQPVAQIIPVQNAKRSNEDRIDRLERQGLIRRGSGDSKKWLAKRRPVKVRGSVLKDLLDERRSGW